MKVFITCTPEVDQFTIKQIVDLLQLSKGAIEFIKSEPITTEDIITELEDECGYKSIEEISRLTFGELYRLCKILRLKNGDKISKENDFVVLITNIDNEMNKNEPDESNKDWFSAFSNKNIFIYSKNWEELTSKGKQYAIAFQIVENIFQSLIKLDFVNWKINPHIHKKPIGCINDMCDDPTEIIYKLHAGYICDDCFNEAKHKKVPNNILLQIFMLLQTIRSEYINLSNIKRELVEPLNVSVYNDKIEIGEVLLKLEPLEETIFRFFLKRDEPIITLNDKPEYNRELFELYYIVKRKRPYTTAFDTKGTGFKKYRDSIDSLCDITSTSYPKTKSNLKKQLINQLGIQYYEFYIIKDVDSTGNEETNSSSYNYQMITLDKKYISYHSPSK